MTEDPFARLREYDERRRLVREKKEAERAANQAAQNAWAAAWHGMIGAMQSADRNPGEVPDLGPVVDLAWLLQDRGYYDWLEEIAKTVEESLDDPRFVYRPGQAFIVRLLHFAGKPGTSGQQLAAFFDGFRPTQAEPGWRVASTSDVLEFIQVRIHLAEKAAGQAAADARSNAESERRETLRKEAGRRPALEKQLFCIYWKDAGMLPRAVRDKWNVLHSGDKIDPDRRGRDEMKKAVQRGRKFLIEFGTTVSEMSELMGLNFGDR